mmetsp:Transcript_117079/g.338420  ORF Transcript_117079/g.338420 Transcript_117079/m.338420 type:complete len:416 (-) Transcript_117079:565-1812(-)
MEQASRNLSEKGLVVHGETGPVLALCGGGATTQQHHGRRCIQNKLQGLARVRALMVRHTAPGAGLGAPGLHTLQDRRHMSRDDPAGAPDVVVGPCHPIPQLPVHLLLGVARRPDHHDLRRRLQAQGEHVELVLEQRHGLRRELPVQRLVLLRCRLGLVQLLVAMRRLTHRLVEQPEAVDHRELPPGHVIDLLFAQRAQVRIREPGGVCRRGGPGHLLVHAILCGEAVQRPPVALHEALEPHGPLEILHEVLPVPASVLAIDQVVGAHRGAHAGLHRRLEGRVVDLKERPVIDAGVHSVAIRLLAVPDEVLHDREHPLRLHALHVGPRQARTQIRRLPGVVLRVPATSRDTVDVHAGAQNHIGALGPELLAQGLGPTLRVRLAPRGGDRQRARPPRDLVNNILRHRAEALAVVLHV